MWQYDRTCKFGADYFEWGSKQLGHNDNRENELVKTEPVLHGSCLGKAKGWWWWVVLDCPINKNVLFNLLCALISFLEHSMESNLLNFCSKELQPDNNDDEIMEI